MRIRSDLIYADLGLIQPEGGSEVGERSTSTSTRRKIPSKADLSTLKLIDKDTAEVFTFENERQLEEFKYQRYLKR